MEMSTVITAVVVALITMVSSFGSAYLTNRLSQKSKCSEMAIERKLIAIESAEFFAITIRSSNQIKEEEINRFIAHCTWFPETVRKLGLNLARSCNDLLMSTRTPVDEKVEKAIEDARKFHLALDKLKQELFSINSLT